ncbi:hypothetical protein BsWGS_09361 [Bradybaena similaris]
MTKISIQPLVFCLLISLSWGYAVKRDVYADRCSVKNGVRTFVPGENQEPPSSVSYGIVCDAGSTSTRLKIFRVNRTEADPCNPQIDLIHNARFEPSLDEFVNDPEGLRAHVTLILSEAKKIVPAEQFPETNIHLLATAGLRFLTADDTTQLFSIITEVFDSFKVRHSQGGEGVGILSGEEEGVYSWVAVNYLLGNFAYNRPDNETVGVLEMGGGSTQISFIPKDPLYDGEFQITINGRYYNLYAHSYLQFGIDAVVQWIAAVLIQLYPDSLAVGNPCMLKGDVKEIQVDNGPTVLLSGTSDPDKCKQVLRQILAPATGLKCNPKPCAIGSVYQPKVGDLKFHAIQGFRYAPLAFNALGPDQVLNLTHLEQEAFIHCRRNLTEAVEAGMDAKVASSNCMMGIYTPTLFTLSYGFPRNTTNIRVSADIAGKTIEWSLGVMVLDVYGNKMTRRRR